MLKDFKIVELQQPVKKNYITFEEVRMTVNRSTAEIMGFPSHVCLLLDAKNKRFALQACEPENSNSMKFSKKESEQAYAIFIKHEACVKTIRDIMNWSSGSKYRVSGTYYPEEHAIVYELTKASQYKNKKKQ